VNKKRINVPVFLIYAGIIHAIGLALLMPMLITLPGPGGGSAPKATSVDVEIVPASPSVAQVEQDGDQTSALPSAQQSAKAQAPVEAAGSEAGAKPAAEAPSAVANVSPEAQPEDGQNSTAAQEEPAEAEPPAKEKTKAASGAAKKRVAQRSKAAKPAIHRSARTQPKITPFNGALSGLFSPGAPANRQR
jgi:hypothetical protein